MPDVAPPSDTARYQAIVDSCFDRLTTAARVPPGAPDPKST
ncbi:hypothetical protein [Nocardia sp. NPDC003354]